MKRALALNLGLFASLLLGLNSCGALLGSLDTSTNETVQSLGDFMGTADESLSRSILALSAPSGGFQTYADSCYQSAYSSCSGDERSAVYDSCRLGSFTLNGGVDFVFNSGSGCRLGVNGDNVRRVPNFTITDGSGNTATVTVFNVSTGGQTFTRTSASTYSYAVSGGGIHRVRKDASGNKTADVTISTSGAITITGAARSGRIMSGGTVVIANNLGAVSESTSLGPDSVKWDGSCTCPTSGEWIGQHTDANGVTADFKVKMMGCGTAEVISGATDTTVTLERCVSL